VEFAFQNWYKRRMQMQGKRRSHSDKFKAKVAIETIKGIKTLSELATEFKIHPNQISSWKRQLQVNAVELFTRGKKNKSRTEEELTAPLYKGVEKNELLPNENIALNMKSLYSMRRLSQKKPYDHGGFHIRKEYQKRGQQTTKKELPSLLKS
jgi:putative transposase